MMTKHKKTRKEKIIADYRHQVYSLEDKNIPLNTSIPIVAVNKNSYSYAYVFNDIFKTGLLTASIIAAQMILFFLLKNHLIKLPNINY